MSSVTIGVISAGCIFSGALLGLSLRRFLPPHHLRDDSKETVKLGAGMIATLSALVLGLLVGSAKSTFDTMNAELTQAGAKLIVLDRALARYGPESKSPALPCAKPSSISASRTDSKAITEVSLPGLPGRP